MTTIIGFGNPLLDITVKLHNNALLKKYNLNEDDEKELPPSKLKELLEAIKCLNPSASPGGSTQNTLRIFKWLLPTPNYAAIMFGAIGEDDLGIKLKTLVESAGVQTRYTQNQNEPTGTAVALVTGTNRSLVAYIGAAKYVSIEDIKTSNELLKTAKIIYMESFFVSEREEVARYIEHFCEDGRIMFAFNLNAVYMCTSHPAELLYFAEKCDILIGNRKEYEALYKTTKLTCGLELFMKNLSRQHATLKNLQYGKIVIMTNGLKPVLCAHSNGLLEEIEVPKLDDDKICDTTGAGDAFAAGFLAGLISGHGPRVCLKWGCWTAQQIIQQIGCNIPDYSPAEFLQH